MNYIILSDFIFYIHLLTDYKFIHVSVNILLTCGIYLHDRIISLRGKNRDHKTSLAPPLFNEVTLTSQESERSCICMMGMTGLIFYFGIFRQCGIFMFSILVILAQ